tara:strand:- start:7445 stop:8074 length:630 start_codon:yes stop_codon:yes gene_type:complete
MSISKKILIVAPHADDEVLGVGGTTSKMLSDGHDVHLIVCSKRSNDLKEYEEAMVHYTNFTWLEFNDERLNLVKNHLLKEIEKIYNKVQPDIVFIPNKDDFNLDHKAVYEVCEIVCRRYQEYPPEMVLMYEVPSSTTQSFDNNFKCNYYVSLTEEEVQNKANIFLKYTNEIREFPNPRNSEGIHLYSRFRGMECSAQYAEGFNLIYSKL